MARVRDINSLVFDKLTHLCALEALPIIEFEPPEDDVKQTEFKQTSLHDSVATVAVTSTTAPVLAAVNPTSLPPPSFAVPPTESAATDASVPLTPTSAEVESTATADEEPQANEEAEQDEEQPPRPPARTFAVPQLAPPPPRR
jgi:hypothetical protein